MKTNLIRPLTSRRAFTLVELIVVLMILVGLAAVLIPAITDMVARTNRSTSASNIGEVAGALQRYEAQYMAYPDKLDSLMSQLQTPTTLNTLLPGLYSLTGITGNVLLDADLVDTLNNAGITTVGRHTANDGTFDLPTLVTLAAGDTLKGLTVDAQEALGLETSATADADKYVILGIGTLCDMNGKTMFDAPVHFPRDTASNPESTYCRFLAVFQITDGADPLTRAKLVCVLAPDGTGLSGELNNYFEIAANN